MSAANEIRRCFPYLFNLYNFKVISETHFESFGNWVVILGSDDYCIRLLQDRGYTDMALGPSRPQPNWDTGPWFNLDLVLSFVSGGSENLSKLQQPFNNLTQQLAELSRAYQPYSEAIKDIFKQDSYSGNEERLRAAQKQWQDQVWTSLRTP